MPKVVITVTDAPDGTVSFVTDPPLQSLLDRRKAHGATALSPGEIYAVLAMHHVLQHAGGPVHEGRSGLILPKTEIIS